MAEYKPNNKTAGEILKERRESRGLSLSIVHETTKIPLDVLKSIEEGYSVRMLSAFYIRGFVKMYAEYLGLDPVAVFEQPIPVLQKSLKTPKLKVTQLPEKEYAIPEGDFELSRVITKEHQRVIVQIVGALLLLFFCIKIVGCMISRKDQPVQRVVVKDELVVSPQKIAEKQLVVAEPLKPAPKKAASAKPSAVKKVESVAGKKEPEENKVRVTIKALKGGWLQVKVDGIVVMESTVKAGAVETWEADREIVISGRTIHNVEFELNGKMIGTLGRQDRNARRVVISKKGLAVKK